MAASARDALTALDGHSTLDAAIVDAVLPGISGFDIAQRAVERGIAVLIITGHPAAVSRLETAACPFLRKPFHLDVLLAELGALIEQSERRRMSLAVHLTKLLGAMVALFDLVELMNVLPSAMTPA